MQNLKIKTYAKINLCLDIVGRREDGYHELKTIMQTVDLSDEIFISKNESSEVNVICDNSLVPGNAGNLAYSAAKAIFDAAGVKNIGADIHIKKRIPVSAGLGGGSSNAAGTLLGLNLLYEFNFTVHRLIQIAKYIGADVPYCIVGGTVLAEGIGEKLQLLPAFNNIYIVLVKVDVGVSTAEVYRRVKLNNLANRPLIEQAVKAIHEKDVATLFASMGNVLEPITATMIPEVAEIKEKMLSLGADVAQMCGSGPTVFAVCRGKKQAERVHSYFKNVYSEVFLCQTI